MESRPILCIAGAKPGVGKTTVAAGLLRRAVALGGVPVGMKPIDPTCHHGEDHDLVSPDADLLRGARGRPLPPLVAVPYRFSSGGTDPLAAARQAGLSLSISGLAQAVDVAAEHGQPVVVEVAGDAGALLAENGTGLDLARYLGARLLLVGPATAEGAEALINLIQAARTVDDSPATGPLAVGGVLMVDSPSESDAVSTTDLERRVGEQGEVPVFPTLPHFERDLSNAVDNHIGSERILEKVFAPQ